MSGIAIGGIVVGALLGVLLVVATAATVVRMARRKHDRRYDEPNFDADDDLTHNPFVRGQVDPFKQTLDQYHVVGGPLAHAPLESKRGV